MALGEYIQYFQALRVNRSEGHASPHKVCLLLAVTDMIESGYIKDNHIYFDNSLVEAFNQNFDQLRLGNDQPTSHLPFYHLKSEDFWHHQVKQGQEELYRSLSQSNSAKRVQDSIAYAYLDDELFDYLHYSVTRDELKEALFQNIDIDLQTGLANAVSGWSAIECELIVRDYLDMLIKEINGDSYSKAMHRRALLPHLNNRTEGSIEYKHQNISAALIDLGFPYIRGYKPAFNYQVLLKDVLASQAKRRIQQIETTVDTIADAAIEPNGIIEWDSIVDEAPEREEGDTNPEDRTYTPRFYNYSERESHNRRLGYLGEEFVIDYEKYRLSNAGRADLANEIEWTSQERGDGAGYDIRSFNLDTENELYIEVKTTNSGKYQPFIISENEVAFSKDYADQYALYRVFDFRTHPRLFQLPGRVDDHVLLVSKQYRASFR